MGTPFNTALAALIAAEEAHEKARHEATHGLMALADREPIRKVITGGLFDKCVMELRVSASRDSSYIREDCDKKSDLSITYYFSLTDPTDTPATVNTIKCERATRFSYQLISSSQSGVPATDNPTGKMYAFPRIDNYPKFERYAPGVWNKDPLTDGATSKLREELFAIASEMTHAVNLPEHIIPAIQYTLTYEAMKEPKKFRQPNTPGRGLLVCPKRLDYTADELRSNYQNLRVEVLQIAEFI